MGSSRAGAAALGAARVAGRAVETGSGERGRVREPVSGVAGARVGGLAGAVAAEGLDEEEAQAAVGEVDGGRGERLLLAQEQKVGADVVLGGEHGVLAQPVGEQPGDERVGLAGQPFQRDLFRDSASSRAVET